MPGVTDMSTELSVRAVHEGGMRMSVGNGSHSVLTDYPLEAGQQLAGLTPMELLLASLACCCGSVVALLLARAGQSAGGVEIHVRGRRRDEHPMVFTQINLDVLVRDPELTAAAVERALAHAEAVCPVWAMLKPATPIVKSVLVATT